MAKLSFHMAGFVFQEGVTHLRTTFEAEAEGEPDLGDGA
jgi:hypothetical protein